MHHDQALAAAPAAGRAGPGRLRAWLTEEGRAWGGGPGRVLALWALVGLVLLTAVAAALLGKDAYKWYVEEDGFAETIQVFAYLAALVLTLRLVPRLGRAGAPRAVVLLYGLLALGLVFMIGEELSWGQRLVGWGTPEGFVEANKQAETNLHNIHGVGDAFKWVQMLAAGFGVFLPILLYGTARLDRWRGLLRWIVPPLALVPFFAPLFLWRIYRNLFAAPERFYFVVSEFNEVTELLFALGIALFLFWLWRGLAGPAAADAPAAPVAESG